MNAPVKPPAASAPLAATDGDHLVFDVSGMTCAACAARIERVLARAPGVAAAAVNLPLERADITVAPGTPPEAIAAAIGKAGFGAVLRGADARARRLAAETREAEKRAEARRDMALLLLAALLTAPLVLPMLTVPFGFGGHPAPLVQWLLATPVQFLCGARFYRGAWKALAGGGANMDVLVSIGTTVTYVFSAAMVLVHGEHAHGHLYFEGSAAVITFILLGKVLEARAKAGTTEAVRALMQLQPVRARRLEPDGRETDLEVEAVGRGDLLVIRPGERVPVDGTIREGASALDEQLITGESLPVERGMGARVIAGSLNGPGRLVIEAVAVGEDTTLARITRLVEAAQTGKAPVQRLVDRISALFVPAVLAIAVLAFAGWLLAGADAERALVAAVSVVVIACPCALGLATPAALVAGTGAAARQGILVAHIEALERAAAIDTVLFDKTGTLTAGRPTLTHALAVDGNRDALVGLAAAVQRGSEHPLARAVVAAAEALPVPVATGITAIIGGGVAGVVAGAPVLIGNPALLRERGIDLAPVAALLTTVEAEGTAAIVARNGIAVGVLGFADPVRPEAADAIATLAARGIAAVMVTGDSEAVAARVADRLKLAGHAAGVRPEGKVAVVEARRAAGRHVAMVGDGLNDAPALAAADLGIAMGSGTDAAIAAAGITLMRPDPRLVPAALDAARVTLAKIRQNLFWAFAFNVIGIPLAAFGLLTPTFAGAAMAMSSVAVVTNSMLLRRWKGA